MLTDNPYAELSALIPAVFMQAYVATMMLCVAGGTLFDIVHKKSASYFFRNWRSVRESGHLSLDAGQVIALGAKALLVDALASGEFCNVRRRIAHLMGMYGFLLYAVTTFVMVFAYSDSSIPTPVLLPILWYLGGLLVCVGGYWFWFFIRVDVAAEGHSPFRLVRADLFVVSLLLSNTAGLIWAGLQSMGSSWSLVFLVVYLAATTLLFVSVPWSKFSHMFYKPAAALQKRIEDANGTRRNLPQPADEPDIFGRERGLPRNY